MRSPDWVGGNIRAHRFLPNRKATETLLSRCYCFKKVKVSSVSSKQQAVATTKTTLIATPPPTTILILVDTTQMGCHVGIYI